MTASATGATIRTRLTVRSGVIGCAERCATILRTSDGYLIYSASVSRGRREAPKHIANLALAEMNRPGRFASPNALRRPSTGARGTALSLLCYDHVRVRRLDLRRPCHYPAWWPRFSASVASLFPVADMAEFREEGGNPYPALICSPGGPPVPS